MKVPPGYYGDWQGHTPFQQRSQLQVMNLEELTFANEKTNQSNMEATGSLSNPLDIEGIQINTNYAGSKALQNPTLPSKKKSKTNFNLKLGETSF